MGMIVCPKCGQQVSDQAEFCYCGERLKPVAGMNYEANNNTILASNTFGASPQDNSGLYMERMMKLIEKQTKDIGTIAGIMVFFLILYIISFIITLLPLISNGL